MLWELTLNCSMKITLPKSVSNFLGNVFVPNGMVGLCCVNSHHHVGSHHAMLMVVQLRFIQWQLESHRNMILQLVMLIYGACFVCLLCIRFVWKDMLRRGPWW